MNRFPDEKSEALLDAARQLLTEGGPDLLTIRSIADRAGLSTMNVYSRFGNKHGILDALYSEAQRGLHDRISAVPATEDPVTDLRTIGDAYREFALENPAYYRLIYLMNVADYEPSPAVEKALGQTFAIIVERVERAQSLHLIVGPDQHDPIDVAALIWANLHGVVSFEVNGHRPGHASWPDIWPDSQNVLLRGLRTD